MRLLQTLPGIDLMDVVVLLVEIGSDVSVFGSAQRLASRVWMCPVNTKSAGKRKSGRIRIQSLLIFFFSITPKLILQGAIDFMWRNLGQEMSISLASGNFYKFSINKIILSKFVK